MRIRFSTMLVFAVLACAAGMAAPLAADTVYLTQGRTMEDVTAELTETQIRIRMSGGEMRLALSEVVRIDKSETPYGRYLNQLARLRDDPATPPSAWLGLARWAQVNELEGEAREAAMIVARLAPRLEGLAPLMRGLGFAFDEETQSWLSHERLMRRRGLVQHRGEWTTPGERAERIRAENDSRRAAMMAEETRRLLRQEAELAAVQRQRVEPAPRVEISVGGNVAYPGLFSYSVPGPILLLRQPGFGGSGVRRGQVRLGPVGGPARQRGRFEPTPGPMLNIFERAPGSLIPARAHF